MTFSAPLSLSSSPLPSRTTSNFGSLSESIVASAIRFIHSLYKAELGDKKFGKIRTRYLYSINLLGFGGGAAQSCMGWRHRESRNDVTTVAETSVTITSLAFIPFCNTTRMAPVRTEAILQVHRLLEVRSLRKECAPSREPSFFLVEREPGSPRA